MKNRGEKRRNERARQRGPRWESFPERLLRKIDESWLFEDMADVVSMEVLHARPTPEDARKLLRETMRMRGRSERLHAKNVPFDLEDSVIAKVWGARVRILQEIAMLEYALSETLEALEKEGLLNE